MDALDVRALDTAKKALSNGRFDWQAYLLLAVAEMRSDGSRQPQKAAEERAEEPKTKAAEPESDEPVERTGTFDRLLSDYRKGIPGSAQSLACFLEAALSELYRSSTGDDRRRVACSCQRIGKLV